ncbi:uncharacterized protein LOC117622478 isoform X1 [Prunus dulcis]|uniref:uncharacterized protein LOC117622478 isoform X1 n=1 Tax=Prunus dulcis TaxID=3755 RepID=UPI001483BD9D|nr:uncharacterized protein LOC117622478 isoform X1 [Prunus dulcis]
MGVLGVQNTSCWETRALSLEEEQILSCFPKEVKKEITSEVVSMSYIKQRELEEACRVKKPFCEWLVTRFQAAGRDRSSFLFWWQEIGSGINIKWVLNAVSIVNLQKREGCTFFDRYHPKIYEPSKSLVLGLLKRLRKEEDENRRLSMEVRASSKGKWSSRACLVIHWMIVIVLLGMLLVEGGARAGLSKNVKLAL